MDGGKVAGNPAALSALCGHSQPPAPTASRSTTMMTAATPMVVSIPISPMPP